MKKTKLTALMTACALALAACSAQEAPKGTVESRTEAPAGESATEESDSAVPDEETAEIDATFDMGDVAGQEYRNEFFDLKLDIPDGWRVLTEEEIAQVTSQVQDTFSDNAAVQAALEDGRTVYDLFALHEESLAEVNIIIGKLGVAETLLVKAGGVENMVETIAGQMPEMLKGTPFENAEITTEEADFCGEKVTCVRWFTEQESPYGTVSVYKQQVYLVQGSYNMTITLTTYLEDTTGELMKRFSRIS